MVLQMYFPGRTETFSSGRQVPHCEEHEMNSLDTATKKIEKKITS
jgi:hypothetical protein